ncbi:hypothetical protein N7528_007998 [Penicillium herquei]|nr:hypothetical protein N7528_007998 [Penicillium herquei]
MSDTVFSHLYFKVGLLILAVAVAIALISPRFIAFIRELIWGPPPPPPTPPPPPPLHPTPSPIKIQSIFPCELPPSLRRRKLQPQPDDGEPAYPSRSQPLGRSTAVDHVW